MVHRISRSGDYHLQHVGQQKAMISPKWRKSECVTISNRPLTPTIWSCLEACGQSMGALVCPVNTARTGSQLTGEQGGVCAFSNVRVMKCSFCNDI